MSINEPTPDAADLARSSMDAATSKLARKIRELRARAEAAEAEVKALRAAWPDSPFADDDEIPGVVWEDEGAWWFHSPDGFRGPFRTRDHAIDAAAGIDREGGESWMTR
jgi:hypothetical protein